ncbi:MAG: MFS transporter [Candidatus Aenigmarchaeota archaeon]|nr:MFS transporter [Candidatus Aenigmarchaeota archaeon]
MDKKLWILFGVVFMDLVGFGVIIPLLPFLVENYGGNALVVGLLVATYSLFQFIFGPVLGRLSDKYGRKPVLFVSSMLNALSYVIIFFSHDLWILFIARTLSGIGGSNIGVAQAYIADLSESHERTRLMALFGAVFGIGFIIGPFIGGFFAAQFSIQTPFLITFIFSFVNSLLILVLLKESLHLPKKNVKIQFFNYKLTREIMQPKNMGFLLVLFFLVNFCSALTLGVFPLFANKLLSWTEGQIGYYFAMIGVVSFISQAFGIRYLLTKVNETLLIRIGLVLFSVGYLMLGFATSAYHVIAAGFLFSLGFSFINPNTQSLISLESKKDEQGVVMGISQSFGSLARVLGPVIGGAIATYQINLPYILSGIGLVVVWVWSRGYLKSFVRTRS